MLSVWLETLRLPELSELTRDLGMWRNCIVLAVLGVASAGESIWYLFRLARRCLATCESETQHEWPEGSFSMPRRHLCTLDYDSDEMKALAT